MGLHKRQLLCGNTSEFAFSCNKKVQLKVGLGINNYSIARKRQSGDCLHQPSTINKEPGGFHLCALPVLENIFLIVPKGVAWQ